MMDTLWTKGLAWSLAADDGHGGGGDLLSLLGIDFNILIIQGVGFLILLFILSKFLWNPMKAQLESRRQDIASTYDKIEADRAHMDRVRSDYEYRLAQIEIEAREKIQAAVSEAQKLREDILEEARKQGEEVVGRAQEQARLEQEKALTEMQTFVTDLALKATERLLNEEMNEPRHKRLVEEFIAKAGAR